MIKKLTVLFAIFCGCVLAEAKMEKKSKAKPAISLQFNEKIYYKLDKAGQDKYLKAWLEFAIQVEKDGYKVSEASFFNSLLIPTAEAADKLCYLAGIAYRAPSCPRNQNELNKVPDSIRGHCSAGQIRCSSAAGLDEQGRSLCVPGSQIVRATVACSEAGKAGNGAAANRLTEKLSSCQSNSSAAGCSQLIDGLKNDTAKYNEFCSGTLANKSYCKTLRESVNQAITAAGGDPAESPGTPTLATDRSIDGCGSVEQQVVSSAFKNQNGEGIDPKWLKMVAMTEKACKVQNFSLIDQLKKFGACTGSGEDIDTDLNRRDTIRSAIAKLESGNNSFNARERGHFQEYFGVSPQDFKKVFCGSTNAKKFKENFAALAGLDHSESALSDKLFGMSPEKIRAIAATSTNDAAKTALSEYATARAEYQIQESKMREVEEACRRGNNVALCNSKSNVQNAMNGIKTRLADARQSFSGTIHGAGGSTNSLESVLGANAVNQIKTDDDEVMDGQRDRGEMNAGGHAQREKFKRCVAENVGEKKTNVTNCHTKLLNSLSTEQLGTSFGQYMFKAKAANEKGRCYISDGKAIADGSCSSGTALWLVPGGSVRAERKKECLENVTSRYLGTEYFCPRGAGSGQANDCEAENPRDESACRNGGVQQ